MRVALVHDWLTGMRGGERVLHELAGLYPHAHLYTLVHVPGSTSSAIEKLPIHASGLSRLPGVARHYRKLLPLFPTAVERLPLDTYDLVVSVSHAVAKGVRVGRATHLSYCLTPMRYIWDQADMYLGTGLRRRLARPLVAYLRRFDQRTSTPARVTRFTAISTEVARRIDAHYGRKAQVVFPPVDVDRFQPSGRAPEDFYLLVAGFVPYKAESVAFEAFRLLGGRRRLVVVGDGPLRARLQSRAPANVEFRGRVSEDDLAALYARCRALIQPQEEDFGIAAVEAQAAGRPVIALGRGGALDSVHPRGADDSRDNGLATGLLFVTQTPAALAEAVERFEKIESEFDPTAIRHWADHFGPERFRRDFGREIEKALTGREADGG